MNVLSLGHASGLYQYSPDLIRFALKKIQNPGAALLGKIEESKLRPAITINNVPHFHHEDIHSAVREIYQRDTARQSQNNEAEND